MDTDAPENDSARRRSAASITLRRAPRRRRGICVALLSATLSACSLHPFVMPEPPAGNLLPGADEVQQRMNEGVAYSRNARKVYYEKLRDEVVAQNFLSSSLIAAGAGIVGLSVVEASLKEIALSALVAGTGYSIGQLNISTPRQQAYVAGMKALGCAETAVVPLALTASQRMQLAEMQSSLPEYVDKTAQSAGKVAAAMPAAERHSGAGNLLVAAAREHLASADEAIKHADGIHATAAELNQAVAGAGARLKSAVRAITDAVNSKVQGTVSSLDALPGAIQSLSDSAAIFAPGLELGTTLSTALGPAAGATPGNEIQALNSTPEAAASEQVLATALGELRSNILKLASRARNLRGLVNSVPASRAVEELESCGVTVEAVQTGLSLTRASVTFTQGVIRNELVRISGGKPNFNARFVSTPTPGLTLTPPGPGDRTILIAADGKTVAGQRYAIEIFDAAQNEATLMVSITGPIAQGETSQERDENPVSLSPWERENDGSDNMRLVQCALNALGTSEDALGRPLALDGQVGKDTRAAMREYQRVRSRGQSGLINKEDFEELRKLESSKPCLTDAAAALGFAPARAPQPFDPAASASEVENFESEFERTMKCVQLKDVREALGMPDHNTRGCAIDAATRRLISNHHENNDIPGRTAGNGLLDQQTFDHLTGQ